MTLRQTVGLAMIVSGVFAAWSGMQQLGAPLVVINYKGAYHPTSRAAAPIGFGVVLIVAGTVLASAKR
jgi:hypothetical protein